MVTINPKRTFTTIRYRHRLQGSTPAKEAELMAYVQAQGGTAIIDGYRVTLANGKLTWEKLPERPSRQLPLFPEQERRPNP